MAKIGIITYHFVANYGAAMQAWALQKHLQSLRHDVFFIDYRPRHLTSGGRFHLSGDAWSRRANLVITYLKLMRIKQMLLGDSGKRRRFEKFHRDYLKIVTELYRTNRALRANPPDADVYICGSDQIWNASEQFGIDSSYFLDFGPPHIKRIAYAASFGRPEVYPRFKAATADLLRSMDAISVREKSAVGIVKALSGKDAEWVPDPTLLIDDGYPEAIVPINLSKDYIFSYTLRSRELVASIEQHLAPLTGLEVVSPRTLAASGAGEPGPLEWLGYIKQAKYVITNSYHGTLFSIIFKKPFVFVGLTGTKASFNERANSLLDGLGLKERMVSSCDESKLRQILDHQIDWERVDCLVNQWRASASNFLKSQIDGGFS